MSCPSRQLSPSNISHAAEASRLRFVGCRVSRVWFIIFVPFIRYVTKKLQLLGER